MAPGKGVRLRMLLAQQRFGQPLPLTSANSRDKDKKTQIWLDVTTPLTHGCRQIMMPVEDDYDDEDFDEEGVLVTGAGPSKSKDAKKVTQRECGGLARAPERARRRQIARVRLANALLSRLARLSGRVPRCRRRPRRLQRRSLPQRNLRPKRVRLKRAQPRRQPR